MYSMKPETINVNYSQTENLAFSGPYLLNNLYALPAIPAVYVILGKSQFKTVYEVLYAGQTGNLAERGFPSSHHAYARWVKEAAGRQPFLAYLPAMNLTEVLRRQLESAIIQTYNPPANRTLDLFPRR